MNRLFLFACLLLTFMATAAQDSVTMYMILPIGPHHTVTFLKDPLETNPTSLPDSFFNTPIQPNHKVDFAEYALVLRFPKEYNYFIFRVDYGYSTFDRPKALIGCLCIEKNSSFRLKSFDYIDSVENSIEIYREAENLERSGKKRKAHKLYKQAAEGGNVLAMMRLAENYRNGTGCLRNTSKAYYWYEQASYFGDEYSASMIRGDSYKHKSVYSVMRL